MALTKKRKVAVTKVDKNKMYSLKDASALVKEINCTKFDSSVDLHIRLGVDPKKPTSRFGVLYPCRMVPVKPRKYWYFVPPIKKQQLKRPVQTL